MAEHKGFGPPRQIQIVTLAGTTEAEAKAVVQTLRAAEDQLSILQHHDAITGTHAAAVGIDYLYNLNKALKPARNAYSEQMYKRLQQRTGLVLENTSLNIKMCGPKQANDTSRDCMPISMDLSKNGSFHVAVLAASCAWSHRACTEVAVVPSGSLQSLDSAKISTRPPPSTVL